ncbi:MAG: host attachment protein [Methyloceanibacter sp.]|uniref:host attachment protein n=1 Tax=Methyloceanibacter sp. TaxID=1965321 RepID=UPI003566EBB2
MFRKRHNSASKGRPEFVLVAPPKVLGEVRQALPATLAKVLTDTFTKDLTKIPDHELPAQLLD